MGEVQRGAGAVILSHACYMPVLAALELPQRDGRMTTQRPGASDSPMKATKEEVRPADLLPQLCL